MMPASEGRIQTPENKIPQELFIGRNRLELADLFEIVDIPREAAGNLDQAVNFTQPWVKGDHTQPQHKHFIGEDDRPRLMRLYERFGMVDEVPVPNGHYDQLLVLGGIQRGNNSRLEFLNRTMKSGRVTAGQIIFLGGQREPYENETDEIDENLQQTAEHSDAWLKRVQEGGSTLKWESDLIRLAALAQLGNLTLKKLHLRLGNPYEGNRPPDPIKRYEFVWNGTPVSLLHTLAVERPNGEPRHTTEACIADWLATYQPPASARVAFVTANPHIERTALSAQVVLRKHKRQDLEFIPSGTAANPNLKETFYLGEVARLLYENQRLLRAE